jgi:hypothetical protein
VLCFNMFARIVLVSFTGMFEYRLVMSKDAKVKYGENWVSCKFWIRSFVFFYVEGVREWSYSVDFLREQFG